jgi:hypothetical protein
MVYNKEGVSARNPFCVDGRTRTNALAQMSNFIGVRSVSGDFVAGVRTELGMFEEFPSGGIEHQKSLWTAK